jgi:hypothetical protein
MGHDPIDSVGMGFECTDTLDGAIGPLGLNRPLVAVTEYNTEKWFFRIHITRVQKKKLN